MRPLRVVMEAFGPYAAQQTLDFAELRGASFFLITGPTGSGKTTVLDAMSFALYGVTSGGPESEGGRSGASMRSDHADPGLLTRVTFDFALGGDLYRIVREPEQERPKLRGDGVTVHGQSATLWRLRDTDEGLAEDGGPLAAGWSKVSGRSEVLLGFRAEQFRQVVMLPQGRFQRLLAADSREREQILRALFDTGHYSAIEAELEESRQGAERRGEDAEGQARRGAAAGRGGDGRGSGRATRAPGARGRRSRRPRRDRGAREGRSAGAAAGRPRGRRPSRRAGRRGGRVRGRRRARGTRRQCEGGARRRRAGDDRERSCRARDRGACRRRRAAHRGGGARGRAPAPRGGGRRGSRGAREARG